MHAKSNWRVWNRKGLFWDWVRWNTKHASSVDMLGFLHMAAVKKKRSSTSTLTTMEVKRSNSFTKTDHLIQHIMHRVITRLLLQALSKLMAKHCSFQKLPRPLEVIYVTNNPIWRDCTHNVWVIQMIRMMMMIRLKFLHQNCKWIEKTTLHAKQGVKYLMWQLSRLSSETELSTADSWIPQHFQSIIPKFLITFNKNFITFEGRCVCERYFRAYSALLGVRDGIKFHKTIIMVNMACKSQGFVAQIRLDRLASTGLWKFKKYK